MITFYNLKEDGTIFLSTPFKRVAEKLSLKLKTTEKIVIDTDGRRYLKSQIPTEIVQDLIVDGE